MNATKKVFSFVLALSVIIAISGCSVSESPSAGQVEKALSSDAASVSDDFSDDFSEYSDNAQMVTLNESGEKIALVSSVDEFLLALGSYSEIVLKPGKYDFTTASDYGKNTFSDYYLWEEVFDGYQLVIHGLSDLFIRGDDPDNTHIFTTPRYANVMAFDGCSSVTLENLTLGHSTAPGACVGGVLHFNCVDAADVNFCRLYGCGTVGLWATDSSSIAASNTEIYNCSDNAAYASSCCGFVLDSCSIHDCPGADRDCTCYSLFEVFETSGFIISNCDIYNNEADVFLYSQTGSDSKLLGCEVVDNYFCTSLLNCTGHNPVIDGCHFGSDQLAPGAEVYSSGEYDASLPALNLDGKELDEKALYSMTLERKDYFAESKPELEDYSIPREIYAGSVDELLAGIAPNTTIYLENGEYLLSDASDYGLGGSNFYYWENCYEGWSLIIHDVENLNIYGLSPVNASILSDCISADVLCLNRCNAVSISGFTLGHSIEGFSCTGGVVTLRGSNDILIDYCRLFGCGILGIDARSCDNVRANYCEIYDCSNGAVNLTNTGNLELTECYIHDCGSPTISVSDNSSVSINGNEYGPGYYTMQSSGSSEGTTMWASGGEAEEFAREIKNNALKEDYDALANKVKYPISIAGKTYKYASQLSRDLDLIIAEDFEKALKDEDFSSIVSDRHGWSIALGYIKFAQYDAELLIYEINPPSVG